MSPALRWLRFCSLPEKLQNNNWRRLWRRGQRLGAALTPWPKYNWRCRILIWANAKGHLLQCMRPCAVLLAVNFICVFKTCIINARMLRVMHTSGLWHVSPCPRCLHCRLTLNPVKMSLWTCTKKKTAAISSLLSRFTNFNSCTLDSFSCLYLCTQCGVRQSSGVRSSLMLQRRF